MLWLYIIVFIGSCLLLVKAGAWVVKSLVRVAQFLEWGEFFVAFILMAFATSLPELFVGLTSAINGRPSLSFGNVIGSNVINLSLAVGIPVLLASGIALNRTIARRDSFYTILFAILPVLMILDGSLSRVDGISLLVGLIFYMSLVLRKNTKLTRVLTIKFHRDVSQFKTLLRDLGVFFGGIALLLLSAQGIVWSSSSFAQLIGVPLVFIGALIVALGTNLPEIVFGIKAVMAKHEQMVLGNLMGSVVVNSTLVLGLTCLIHPLKVPNVSPYLIGIVWTIVGALIFYWFAASKESISRKEAVFLIELYVLFIIVQLIFR